MMLWRIGDSEMGSIPLVQQRLEDYLRGGELLQ